MWVFLKKFNEFLIFVTALKSWMWVFFSWFDLEEDAAIELERVKHENEILKKKVKETINREIMILCLLAIVVICLAIAVMHQKNCNFY